MTQVMHMERLITIVAAYGASPGRWPAEERAAAEALSARIMTGGTTQERAQLAAAMAEAQALDGALGGLSAAVPDAAVARLTAAVAFPPPRRPARSAGFDLSALVRAVLRPSAAVAATMAMLGIFVGFSVDPAYSNGDGSDYSVVQTVEALAPDGLPADINGNGGGER